MGASTHTEIHYGKDYSEVFARAAEQDRYENGHSYSGGIGMANGVELVRTPPLSEEAAEKLAWELVEQGRVQKWEAALAIPIVSERRTETIRIKSYQHPVDYADANEVLRTVAEEALSIQRKKRRGEKVLSARAISYSTPDTGRGSYYSYSYNRPTHQTRNDVTLEVTIQRASSALTPERIAETEPDGFLFIGCYSS